MLDEFGGPVAVREVPDPVPAAHGVVVRVEATGLCRSDWHGWAGHDRTIALPHVPGHELAGTVAEAGPQVRGWQVGDRVTVPFVCACGTCRSCLAGDHQVCDRQTQPGFTGWGSFAELVALDHADVNLVALPDELDAVTAAALGCRFATAYRAVVQQGRVRPGDWVAVHGCGGVGLSAVMVAVAAGARVVAVDVTPQRSGAGRTVRRGRAGRRLVDGRRRERCATSPAVVRRVAGRARQPRDGGGLGAQPGQARPARAGRPAAARPGRSRRCRWRG